MYKQSWHHRQHRTRPATSSSTSPGLGEAWGPGKWQGAATGLSPGRGQGGVAAWGSPALRLQGLAGRGLVAG